MTQPTHPGQAVKSLLDGTLGVTVTAPRSHPCGPLVTVMFIGSFCDVPFRATDLTTTTLTEDKDIPK